VSPHQPPLPRLARRRRNADYRRRLTRNGLKRAKFNSDRQLGDLEQVRDRRDVCLTAHVVPNINPVLNRLR